MAEGYNPLCGDRLTVYLVLDDGGTIRDIGFQGEGCAISTASASLMTEALKGKTETDARTVFGAFRNMVSQPEDKPPPASLGKLAALAGVRAYPSRVKCATLCWHTLESALKGGESATTE